MKEFTFTVYSKCKGGHITYEVNTTARDGVCMMASVLYLDCVATVSIRSSSTLFTRDRVVIDGLYTGGYRVEIRVDADGAVLYVGDDIAEAVKKAIDAAEEVLT